MRTSELAMSDHALLQSILTALAATWWIPLLLRRRPAGLPAFLALAFVAFFAFNLTFLLGQFEFTEAIARSALAAAVPLAGGWLFFRATRNHLH